MDARLLATLCNNTIEALIKPTKQKNIMKHWQTHLHMIRMTAGDEDDALILVVTVVVLVMGAVVGSSSCCCCSGWCNADAAAAVDVDDNSDEARLLRLRIYMVGASIIVSVGALFQLFDQFHSNDAKCILIFQTLVYR